MADERIFKVKIDGLEESYKNTVKLVEVLNAISDINSKIAVQTDNVSKATSNSTNTSKDKTKALTDEEKAQKKLADTQAKANSAISEMEKEQVKANIQLKERAKQLTNLAKLELAAKNSPAEFKAELALLNQEWNNISEGTKEFEELTVKIEALTNKLKEAEAAKGTFTRNVGNYKSATEGLNESFKMLGDGVNATAENTKGLLSLMQSGVGTAQAFGEESETLKGIMSEISKIMPIVNSLQAASNILLTKGAIASKTSAAMEGVHALQIRARALSISLATKNTIAATIAQRVFNAVAKANPYVLIALGATAAIGAIIGLAKAFNDGTEAQKKYASAIDKVTFATKESRDAHDSHLREIRDLRLEYDVLTGTLTEYEATLQRINNQKLDKITEATNAMNDAMADSKEKAEDLASVQKFGWIAPVASAYVLYLQNESIEAEKVTKESIKNRTEIEENEEKTRLERLNIEAEKRKKQQNELQQQLTVDLLKGKDKELAALRIAEEKEVKQYSDTGLDTVNVRKKYTIQRAEIESRYRKEAIEKGKQHAEDLKRIEETIQKYENDTLALKKQTRDSEIEFNKSIASSIQSITLAYDGQKKAIQANQEESIAAAQKEYNEILKIAKKGDRERLEKDLKDRIIAINVQTSDQLMKVDKERDDKIKEFNQKALDNRKKLLDIELAQIENFYNDAQRLRDRAEVKDSNGIINVEATKKNLEQIDTQLNQYVTQLQNSKDKVSQYYDDLASVYESDSTEYKQAQQQKTETLKGIENKTKDTNKEITENVKESTDLQKKYFESLGNVIEKYTDAIMQSINAVFDAVGSSLQYSLDDANAKLDEITSRYDDVVSKRQESSQKIQELENEAKNATGERAELYRTVIDQEMEANRQLANQQKELATEKAKQEAEVAKKEKQQKRLQLMSDIANATANVAMAATKAMSQWGFPLGTVFAGILAATGAVQVGIMSKQLSKLEDGGLLKGKRHSNGGMRVEGTNIEVEGGEYVINRQSTASNLGLIRYINSERRELKPGDINNFFSKTSQGFEPPFKKMFADGGQLPDIANNVNIDTETMIEGFADAVSKLKVVTAIEDIRKADSDYTEVTGNDI